MHGVQKLASDSGHVIARGAETCLGFRACHCTGCRNMPQIQGIFLHGVQKRASDSGQTFAWGAETCLRFRAYLCTGCRNVPRIQGRLLHGVQKRAPDPGQTYARCAKPSPSFESDFYRVETIKTYHWTLSTVIGYLIIHFHFFV